VAEAAYDPFGAGPFAVGVRSVDLVDRARGRRFPCDVWYPQANVRRPLPLVVFSHLSGGSRRSSTFLCTHLAGHGYVVAALDHSEVVAPELAGAPGESASARARRVAAIVASRVPDVRFLLTCLLDDGSGGTGDDGGFGGLRLDGLRLDGLKVAVVGHSFGGWTALSTPEFEQRIRSVVALAPGGSSRPRPGILPVEVSFAWGRDVPTLFLAGDEDVMTPLEGVVELFQRTPATKRMFVVKGADHLHFVDDVEQAHESLRQSALPGEAAWIPAAMRPLAELCPPERAHETIRGLTLAHLDTTLRNDHAARDFLERYESDTSHTRW
jgi:predicted dienelactone hydrolase